MAGTRFIPITIQLGLGNSLAQVQRLEGQLASAGQRLSRFSAPLTIGLTAPLTGLAGVTIDAAKSLDSLTRGLNATTGSSVETERQLVRLREAAKLPGLGFEQLVEGSINLQQAGLSAQFSERSMKAFGNALATVGKGKSELDGVNLALTQIANNEFLQGDELNQLRERVPQVTRLLKEAFGTVDTEKLKAAGITSRRVLETLVTQLEKLPKVTGGAQNSFDNLADSYRQASAEFGKAELRLLVPLMERAAPIVENLGKKFGGLSTEAQNSIIYIGGAAAALGPLSYGAASAVNALSGLAGGVRAVTAAITSGGLLTAIGSINPVIAGVTIALAAGGIAWYEYKRRAEESAAAIEQAARKASGSIELLNGERNRTVTLADGSSVNLIPGRDTGINPALTRNSTIKATSNGGFSPITPTAAVPVPKIKLADKGRAGAKGTKPETELDQLNRQLKELNGELGILGKQSSDEFSLRLSIAGLRDAKSEIEDLLQLQREAGIQGEVPQIAFNTGKRGVKNIFDFAAIREQSRALRGDNLSTVSTDQLGSLNVERFEVAIEAERAGLEKRGDVLETQQKAADNLVQSTEDLREQLAALKDPSEAGRARREIQRLGLDSNASEAQDRLQAAQALDEFKLQKEAQDKYQDALEDSRRATERFASQLRGTFEDVLGSLLRGDFKGAGGILKNFGAGIGQQALGNLFFGSGQTAGAGAGGSGLSLKGLLGLGGDGGSSGLLSGLFRTPSFNPAGSGGGGFNLSGLLGGGKGGGLVGSLLGKAGSLFGLGSTAASAAPAVLASGAIPLSSVTTAAIGGLSTTTAAATAAGAGSSAGLLGTLGALASNPFTIAAAAAIGGFLAFRYFKNRNRFSKDVRKAIQSEYGVDVKSKDVLKQIEEIAKSRFGKDYKSKASEAARLPEVRDIVAQFAEDTGQKGNGKLFDQASLSDPFSSSNFFQNPAPVSNFTPSAGSTGFVPSATTPSAGGGLNIIQAAQIGTNTRLAEAIEMLVGKVQAIELGQILVANSGAVGEAYREDFRNNPANGELIGLSVNP